ncbi:MAG: hypothetical protein ACFB03_18690 [Paracoccaceae bacterium]
MTKTPTELSCDDLDRITAGGGQTSEANASLPRATGVVCPDEGIDFMAIARLLEKQENEGE